MIKFDTCFTKFHSSSIDLFLTNKPNFFQKTNAIETGLGDHQKLLCTFLKSCYDRLKPKIVYYRNYKKFNEAHFSKCLKTEDPNGNCDFLTNTSINIVNNHVPQRWW